MISLSCTSCKKLLEIDDAFAGGVCRCQYCGTIQTVPSALKKVIRPGSPGVGAKTLYQRTTGNTSSSAAALVSAAAKSAASASGGPARAAAPPVTVTVTPAARRPRILIAIAIVALVVIIGTALAITHLHF
jgi:hypothetical protein